MPDVLTIEAGELVANRGLLQLILPVCTELLRRRDHAGFSYSPDDHELRNQLAFHKSTAGTRMVFGGNQSGKSKCAAMEIKWWLEGNHPYQETPEAPLIYVISANYRTLQEGIYRHLKDVLAPWEVERWGQNIPLHQLPGSVTMRNGARAFFLSGDGREDARRKLQAAACDLILIDEEVDEALFMECLPRLVARDGRFIVTTTLVRSEPWCLELEDRGEAGDPSVAIFRFSSYRAAEAGHISAKKVKEMEVAYSEQERQVRLEGKSRRNEGLVYSEWNGDTHTIKEHFDPPQGWTRYCAIDPGFRFFAVLWAAVARDGKYVIYRELYLSCQQAIDVIQAIAAAEGYKRAENGLWYADDSTEVIEGRFIDPSAFGHHDTGEVRYGVLFAQYSAQLGLGTRLVAAPARNDVLVGIEACRRALAKDVDGVPKARVLSTCKHFLREIRSYRWTKDDRPDGKAEAPDKPIKRRDHLMDCWRYLENMGLSYVEPQLSVARLRSQSDAAVMFGTTKMDDRMREHWDRITKRKGEGRQLPPHPGGLGSEY